MASTGRTHSCLALSICRKEFPIVSRFAKDSSELKISMACSPLLIGWPSHPSNLQSTPRPKNLDAIFDWAPSPQTNAVDRGALVEHTNMINLAPRSHFTHSLLQFTQSVARTHPRSTHAQTNNGHDMQPMARRRKHEQTEPKQDLKTITTLANKHVSNFALTQRMRRHSN